LRERLNKSYTVGAYFWGKTLSEFPFHVFYPALNVAVTYYAIGLNDSDPKYFFILMAAMICTYFYGVSYGFLISIVIPKMEMAMAFTPVLVIPFMVLGGFFVNTNNIPSFLKWLEYLSMFKYGY
jgi:ABC-type multidrug transport system permease subunit